MNVWTTGTLAIGHYLDGALHSSLSLKKKQGSVLFVSSVQYRGVETPTGMSSRVLA